MKISNLKGREILDSRGDPTVEVELFTSEGIRSIASVPSGASVGTHEALELRDNDPARFGGMGVTKAINNIEQAILSVLKDQEILRIRDLDQILLEIDGTEHMSKLGANATLAVSIAATKALSAEKNLPVFSYIAEIAKTATLKMPLGMFNFIEGAKHAENNLQIQEFLAIPEAETFKERYRLASESFHRLKKILEDQKLSVAVGHEGGFAPNLSSDEEALKLIIACGKLQLALDMAGVLPSSLTFEKIFDEYKVISAEDLEISNLFE